VLGVIKVVSYPFPMFSKVKSFVATEICYFRIEDMQLHQIKWECK
jgi:hypothetical protein